MRDKYNEHENGFRVLICKMLGVCWPEFYKSGVVGDCHFCVCFVLGSGRGVGALAWRTCDNVSKLSQQVIPQLVSSNWTHQPSAICLRVHLILCFLSVKCVLLPVHLTQARIQDFGQGCPAEFWPQGGGVWAQNLLKIGVFPLTLPENCMILKKCCWQGGPGPLDPLLGSLCHWTV